MYMGEIARRIILRLAEEGGLFGDDIPDKLRTPMTLSTPQMAKIDHDSLEGLPITSGILSDVFGLTQEQLTLEAMQTVSMHHCNNCAIALYVAFNNFELTYKTTQLCEVHSAVGRAGLLNML